MVVKRDSELIVEKWWFVKGILGNEANICILIWLQLVVFLKNSALVYCPFASDAIVACAVGGLMITSHKYLEHKQSSLVWQKKLQITRGDQIRNYLHLYSYCQKAKHHWNLVRKYYIMNIMNLRLKNLNNSSTNVKIKWFYFKLQNIFLFQFDKI